MILYVIYIYIYSHTTNFMCFRDFPLWFHKVPQEQREICSPTAAGLRWLRISRGLQLKFAVRTPSLLTGFTPCSIVEVTSHRPWKSLPRNEPFLSNICFGYRTLPNRPRQLMQNGFV